MKGNTQLERAFAECLGDMVMGFATTEALTRLALQELLKEMNENEVHALTSELSFRKARAVLLAIYTERNPHSEALAQLRGLMKRTTAVEHRRNALIHSAWLYGDLPDAMVRKKIRVTDKGVVRIDRERFPRGEELDEFVEEILQLTSETFDWLEKFLNVDFATAE